MDPTSYYPSFRFYLPPNISDAGNIWTDGPTYEGIVVYSIITPIICAFGIIGNVLSLVVLSRRELKGSIYVYLAVLAFVDLCSSILLFMSGLSCGVLFLNDWPIYDVLLGLPLASFFNTMAVLTTTMVTVDRILYLANPLTKKKPKLCRSMVARKMMFICTIIALIINMPYCFIFESDSYGQLKTKSFYYSREYKIYNWARFAMLGLVPSILLIIGNGFLIYTLHKLKKIYTKCNESIKCKKPRNYTNLTTVLILIIFFFLISQIPSILTSRATAGTFFFEVDDSGDTCNSKSLETVRQVSTVINAISLSADFVLYYLFCPPFYKVLGNIFRRTERTKSVQMNVFVLDKQICFDKSNIKSIKDLTTGKLFEMMDAGYNADNSSLSEKFEEDDETPQNHRQTITTICSNNSNN